MSWPLAMFFRAERCGGWGRSHEVAQDPSPLPMYALLLVFLSSGVTCNQCTRNADCVYCGFWYLFFYLLKTSLA